jgi:hypothetical protein
MKKPMIVLLHVGYWLLYLLLVFMFTVALSRDLRSVSVGHLMFAAPMSVFFWVPAITGFYLFYLFLFPRFLQKKKIPALVAGSLVIALAGALTGGLVLSASFGPDFMFLDGTNSFTGEIILMSLIALIHGIIALVMRGFISWYGDIQVKTELNKRTYDMEVALIKAQINPHFLFNTINNIDVLIKKDPDKASDFLNKLSDILRFTLYEAKAEKISLSRELDYVSRFVALQRIRSSNPDYIHYTAEGDAAGILIEPMLFIPFIENAFKHAENKKAENAINIRFRIDKNTLEFSCSNAYTQKAQEKPEHSGLGNELIKRRLELLYPGRYSLDVQDSNGNYTIKFVLSLQQ